MIRLPQAVEVRAARKRAIEEVDANIRKWLFGVLSILVKSPLCTHALPAEPKIGVVDSPKLVGPFTDACCELRLGVLSEYAPRFADPGLVSLLTEHGFAMAHHVSAGDGKLVWVRILF